METTALKFGEDLSLPYEVVTQKLAWLGISGSGKTYGATKLAELMLGIGAQIVVLDPVGVWYGLRLAGIHDPKFKIVVFGGLHGDLPLDTSDGSRIADLVVERNISAILDVSQFEDDDDRERFATDFAARFFFRKKAARSAVHLFVDECQDFVPQEVSNKRMLATFNRLIKMGRNFGIGISLISQRPQEVNKKVLNQTEVLFAFRMNGPHERATVESWASTKGYDSETSIGDALPTLKTGQPHVWSPNWLGISRVVRILPKMTRDVSETPKVGVAPIGHEALPPIDIEALRAHLKALTPEVPEDEADDEQAPAAYRARTHKLLALVHKQEAQIDRLHEELHSKRSPLIDPQKLVVVLEALRSDVEVMNASYKEATSAINELLLLARGEDADESDDAEDVPELVEEEDEEQSDEPEEEEEEDTASTGAVDGVALNRCARVLLAILARRKKATDRTWLSVHSGYSLRSSGVTNALSSLRTNGFIKDVGEGDAVAATVAGQQHARKLNEYTETELDDPEAARAFWLNTRSLSKAQRKVLAVVFDKYPHKTTEAGLSKGTGYSRTSSGLVNAVSNLRTRGFVQGSKSEVRAHDAFFTV